jgi:hypothetical protein
MTSECGRIYQWIWHYEHGMGGREPSKADKTCHVLQFVQKEIETEMRKCPKCVLVVRWK